jgi:hypothetical protein
MTTSSTSVKPDRYDRQQRLIPTDTPSAGRQADHRAERFGGKLCRVTLPSGALAGEGDESWRLVTLPPEVC